jgi:FtsP/CotA-like multicopper oxidase with cupredoxin domain
MSLYNGNSSNSKTRLFIFTVLLSGVFLTPSLGPAHSQAPAPTVAQLQQQLQEAQRQLQLLQQQQQQQQAQQPQPPPEEPTMLHVNGTGDPCAQTGNYLTSFSCGTVDDNKTRHFTLMAQENTLVTISEEGQQFLAWTYNGSIPGPTLRMTEGDAVQVTVINNGTNKLPHSLHMHSIHPGTMDGVTGEGGAIPPGGRFTYSFTAEPAGVYPYHCHVNPIADHINRGLFGAMIIDPKGGREAMPEMVMVLNGYDLNYEQEGPTELPDVNSTNPLLFVAEEADDEERDNEIYTVNGFAFGYMKHPIQLDLGETYRVYLVNMLEFDLVNSLHVHGMMFNYIPSGTAASSPITTDIVTLGQGDRGIMEMTATKPGHFMFHAHQAEFSDLGWMSMFVVT